MSKPLTITCPGCGGSGQAPLTPVLQRTLDALVELAPCTAAQIYAHIGGRPATGVGLTAINNHLRELHRLGLTGEPQKFGRELVFEPSELGRSGR